MNGRLAAVGHVLLWGLLWLAVMAAALHFRPLLPVDETRYLAVAWEMWRTGDFLVPHLNGEPYSHKPPLLFWLIHAGWALFGVNDWSPRLVAPLFGLASLMLTGLLARRLWPGRPTAAAAAPLILFACLFWTLFTTLTMFDMMLAFCALLGMLGIVRAWQDDNPGGFLWLALAIGIGALAKGPAILVSVLPAALLAPLWAASPKLPQPYTDGVETEDLPAAEQGMWSRGWKHWYMKTGLALLGGVAIGLAWAVPAAVWGGEEYRNAIFWGQSAGRMVDSFAHGRPWWWFLAVLPGLVLPWTVWPASWRALKGLLDIPGDNGLRFCLVWFLPALLVFSAISGKQLHYLLPVFPALALMLGRLLIDHHATTDADITAWSRSGLHIPGLLFILFGLVLGVVPLLGGFFDLPPVIGEVNFIWGLVLALGTFAVLLLTRRMVGLTSRLATLAILSTALVAALHLSLKPALEKRFDLQAFSETLGQWQREGTELAFLGKYHGLFNFMGRLERTVATVGLKDPDLKEWLAANPDGRMITVVNPLPEHLKAVHWQPFRGRFLAVYDAAQVIANPSLVNRR